jgi:hypothetical protein
MYRRFEKVSAMANEDLTHFEGLLSQLLSHENTIRQQAEVRTLNSYMFIYFYMQL